MKQEPKLKSAKEAEREELRILFSVVSVWNS